MNSAYGNTRLARLLVRVCAIADALALCMTCCAMSLAPRDGNVVWWLFVAAFVVGNAATALFAYRQGLLFEWRVERVWKRVCHGIGFKGEGVSILRSVRAGIASRGRYYVETQTKTIYPKLREVQGTWESFTGTVTFFDGQTLEQFNDAAPAFAMAFNCRYVGFERSQNGLLRIRVGEVPVPGAYNYGQVAPSPSQAAQLPQTANVGQSVPNQNVIQQVVPSVYTAPQPDYRVANVWAEELALLRAVPMARNIDGNVWKMPIEENHVLIAANTGGGKGSWIWSLIFGLVPAWEAGLVQFYGIDPKLNELAMGRDFFKCYADNDEDSVALLEECVRLMNERGRAMQGIRRKFVPSLATPLIVLVIDELGYLSALLPDKKLRERANTAITALLVRGRSPGIAVVGAVQDPRKEVVNNRDLYTIRIAGRMPAPMVDLVLGEGAYEAGALCDQIPPPYAGGSGVAYVLDVMSMEPRLVRAAWCSDDDIRGMASGVLRPKPQPGTPSGSVWEQLGVKDEQLSGQLDWNGQPLQQWQYKVE